MVSKPFQRPFSLATRLTFFISLATIAAVSYTHLTLPTKA